jgi:glycosyltransferase involved in cell wall biosynthesis
MDRFVRVLAALNRTGEFSVRGLIVGTGPLREELESQAKCLGLSDGQLEFRGSVSRMTSVYAEVDVLVLTSEWEGTPNVVLEAMATGLPVVATNVGGVSDILNDEVGFLVENDDERTMLKHLSHLVADSSRRQKVGRGAAVFVKERFSHERLSADLKALYNRSLSAVN